jgi:hypothetical protein
MSNERSCSSMTLLSGDSLGCISDTVFFYLRYVSNKSVAYLFSPSQSVWQTTSNWSANDSLPATISWTSTSERVVSVTYWALQRVSTLLLPRVQQQQQQKPQRQRRMAVRRTQPINQAAIRRTSGQQNVLSAVGQYIISSHHLRLSTAFFVSVRFALFVCVCVCVCVFVYTIDKACVLLTASGITII